MYALISNNVAVAGLASILTLLVVGVLEELVKSGVVRFIDKTRIGIQTINDAVEYSILAGLGFAFVENISYFYQIWQNSSSIAEAVFPMVFRSIFTVLGHAVFSGIFGYFYGIAKFSMPILEAKIWMGERSKSIQILSKILGTNEANAFRQVTLFKGLFIAMAIHVAFNFALEMNQFLPVVFLVGGGFLYLLYLLAHKAGNIVFTGEQKESAIAKRDTDVVLELLGMWTQEGKYQDVVDICQRLLIRDPDNKVVQLFEAKALEKEKFANLEKSVTSLFTTGGVQIEDKSLRALIRQKVLMEMLKDKQSIQPEEPQKIAQASLAQKSSGPRIPTIIGGANPQQKSQSSPKGNL